MLNHTEKNFIESGFRAIDEMTSKNDLWLYELPDGMMGEKYMLLSGDDIAAQIVKLLEFL
jgi:hypothetical protein